MQARNHHLTKHSSTHSHPGSRPRGLLGGPLADVQSCPFLPPVRRCTRSASSTDPSQGAHLGLLSTPVKTGSLPPRSRSPLSLTPGCSQAHLCAAAPPLPPAASRPIRPSVNRITCRPAEAALPRGVCQGAASGSLGRGGRGSGGLWGPTMTDMRGEAQPGEGLVRPSVAPRCPARTAAQPGPARCLPRPSRNAGHPASGPSKQRARAAPFPSTPSGPQTTRLGVLVNLLMPTRTRSQALHQPPSQRLTQSGGGGGARADKAGAPQTP